MLKEQERNQVIESLNEMVWTALNKYEALKAQSDALDKRIDAAWGVYRSASEARDKAIAMPYVAVDDVLGEYVVEPTTVLETAGEQSTVKLNQGEVEALSA